MHVFTYETTPGLFNKDFFFTEIGLLLERIQVPVDFDFKPLPEKYEATFKNWDGTKSPLDLMDNWFRDDVGQNRVLICTEPDSSLAYWCKKDEPSALWGCCLTGMIAVDYAPKKSRIYNQLHELLHLAGVDDCYLKDKNKTPKQSCDHPDCLMRYGMNSKTVCSSVATQLRNFAINNNCLNSDDKK